MRRIDCTDPAGHASVLALAAGALRRNELVVLPTDAAYAVACDAFSPVGVQRLNEAKGRTSTVAVPVMIGSLRALDGIVTGLDPAARELLSGFWPGPLTAICHSQPSLQWNLGGDDGDESPRVAVRMPLHPMALALLQEVGPLAVISANRVGEPVPIDCDAAVEQLGDAVSVYLDAGSCPAAMASTVVDLTASPPRLLRRGALAVDLLCESLPELLDVDEPAPTAGNP